MKIVIFGSRDITDLSILNDYFIEIINTKYPDLTNKDITIISGGARGVDTLGEQLAELYGFKLEVYPADWDRYGKSAGYRRNITMAQIADIGICLWDGKSRGTRHMINTVERLAKPCHVLT